MLYLMRHATQDKTPEQALSPQGVQEANLTATYLKSLKIKPTIYHSEKLRAKQTASIVAKTLNTSCSVIKNLKPNDPLDFILESIPTWTSDTLLVGHLPYLPKLLSSLLLFDESHNLFEFNPASVIGLKNTTSGWIITQAYRPLLS